jgi:hypothetical protein
MILNPLRMLLTNSSTVLAPGDKTSIFGGIRIGRETEVL